MKKQLLLPLLTSGLLSIGIGQAAILAGDTIVIDFTKTGAGVGGNWNDIDEADGGTDGFAGPGISDTLIASDLIRFSDGTGTGVGLRAQGLEVSSPNNTDIGIGGLSVSGTDSSASFAVSGAIPSAAQLDVTFHVNGQTQFVFTGLNDTLTYNLSFQSWAGTAGRTALNWVVNPGETDEATFNVDSNDSNPSVYTVSGLSANASDQIILRHDSVFGGTAIGHINAMELTAIPEPSTFALFGLAGLAAMFAARRRR